MNMTLTHAALDPDFRTVMDDYRHRQMVEHLTGPMLSLIVHVTLVICACLVLIRHPAPPVTDPPIIGITPIPELVLDEILAGIDGGLELPNRADIPVDRVPVTPPRPEVMAAPALVDFLRPPGADVAFDPDQARTLMQVPSNMQIPVVMGQRPDPAARQRALDEGGGSELTEAAVLRALIWLKDNQETDGSWSPKQYTEAMTGLALLTFLAHGETLESPEYGPTVLKGTRWLVNHMLAKPRLTAKGYSHAIATYALAEADCLMDLPILRPALDLGLSRIVAGQQEAGGFDYNYAKGERWDLSVTAWQIQALKTGQLAGSQVPGVAEALEQARQFVATTTYKDGRFGYSSPGSGSWGMQGAGILSLQMLGHGKSRPIKAATENLARDFRPVWDDQSKHQAHSHPSYAWYYCTQALFHSGKRAFSGWNRQFAPMLIRQQKADGHWECPGDATELGPFDPYFSTTLNALSLQVYYRNLRSFETPALVKAAPAASVLGADIELLIR